MPQLSHMREKTLVKRVVRDTHVSRICECSIPVSGVKVGERIEYVRVEVTSMRVIRTDSFSEHSPL